jgi:hypothetical protein
MAHRNHHARLAGRCPRWALGALASCGVLGAAAQADARTLADFRYFRALSIDLQGRMPTREEVRAFEDDSFDVDAWIDQKLTTPEYADRVRRVYMDLLRLEVGSSFQFVQSSTVLRREPIMGPDGKTIYVYFRASQRRTRPETDAAFCLTQAETGLQFPRNADPTGTAKPVSQAVLDQYTRVVKPWWLYRDYDTSNPADLYDPATWAQQHPGYVLADGLASEDGTNPTTSIRVCAEETGATPTALVTTPPFSGSCDPKNPPFGRLDCPPKDTAAIDKLVADGTTVDCRTQTGYSLSSDCGCGVGLEACMPGAGDRFDNPAFALPSHPVAGLPDFDSTEQTQASWARVFWGQEAAAFFDDILLNDKDFRQVLTGRQTMVNGPLAQFYKFTASGQCCGNGTAYGEGYVTAGKGAPSVPLFDPKNVPADLLPHDVAKWEYVPDRGPEAAGIMTMPVFLTKFGSRRARAHVLWTTFACKDFIAGNVTLKPSTEPDLTKRDGCNLCHATLEPLAAYFTRVQESTWNFLPADRFPVAPTSATDPGMPSCFYDPTSPTAKPPRSCTDFYDPAFTTTSSTMLRGAYAAPDHADAGPKALAQYLTQTSQFQSCVAENVATSFLGRTLTSDDAALQAALAESFASNGYSMRALVKALVVSDAYKKANNLSSTAWRQGAGQ